MAAGTSPKIQPATLRAAETADTPRIAALIIAAMELSPHWRWRYPYRKQFPDIHRRETESRISDYIKKSKDGLCVVTVAELESVIEVEIGSEDLTTEDLLMGSRRARKRKERRVVREVVGVVVAQLPGTFVEPMTRLLKASGGKAVKSQETVKSAATAPQQPHRADGHEGRTKAFLAEFGPAKKRYFDQTYGNHQMYIDYMAVDPAFHRRGIALQLMNWTLDLARQEEDAKAVTLFSSPLGEALYRKAGFEIVGSVTVKLEGDTGEEAEGIEAPVMVWLREKHPIAKNRSEVP